MSAHLVNFVILSKVDAFYILISYEVKWSQF